jgi:hypothetical protein
VSDDTPKPDFDDPADDTPVGEPAVAPTLASTLLHEEIANDDRPGRRWAYPWWGMALVSLYVLYHAVVLLVHNLPSGGLGRGLHKSFDDGFYVKFFADENDPKSGFRLGTPSMRDYMRATGNTQSWAMFAPNPHRSNVFMKVLVKDKNGDVFDMKHDIWQVDRYPYLFYDRMGKINRRIIEQKGYRRHYAAWVCRDWERTHGGEPAEEIQFVKMWTKIPEPEKVIGRAGGNPLYMTYDPWQLHLHQREEDTIKCATNRHGQLPDYLRERYGFPPDETNRFRGVEERTWWDEREAKERAQERRDAAASLRTDQLAGEVPEAEAEAEAEAEEGGE